MTFIPDEFDPYIEHRIVILSFRSREVHIYLLNCHISLSLELSTIKTLYEKNQVCLGKKGAMIERHE